MNGDSKRERRSSEQLDQTDSAQDLNHPVESQVFDESENFDAYAGAEPEIRKKVNLNQINEEDKKDMEDEATDGIFPPPSKKSQVAPAPNKKRRMTVRGSEEMAQEPKKQQKFVDIEEILEREEENEEKKDPTDQINEEVERALKKMQRNITSQESKRSENIQPKVISSNIQMKKIKKEEIVDPQPQRIEPVKITNYAPNNDDEKPPLVDHKEEHEVIEIKPVKEEDKKENVHVPREHYRDAVDMFRNQRLEDPNANLFANLKYGS